MVINELMQKIINPSLPQVSSAGCEEPCRESPNSPHANQNVKNEKTEAEQLAEAVRLVREGNMVEIHSGVLGEVFVLVKDEYSKFKLKQRSEQKPIYTLQDIYYLKDMPPEDLIEIHKLKTMFDATLLDRYEK